jgi:hypothetical protein
MPSASHQSPRIGLLALLTYGLVILTVIVAVAGYRFYLSRVPQPAPELADTRTVQVGAVWVPPYPGASLQAPTTQLRGDLTDGSMNFKTSDPAAQVVSFFESTLRRTGYQTSVAANNVAGGTVQAIRLGGRTRIVVTVESTREGSAGTVRTLHREEKR